MPDFSQAGAFDAWKREAERRSLDTMMVYNPTNKEYRVVWDKRIFPIPACDKDMGYGPGKMEVYRYICDKYYVEMRDLIINSENKEKADKMLADHYAKGREELSKHDENIKIHDKGMRTDNERRGEELYDLLVLGLVREYSAGYIDDKQSVEDMRPIEERIAERSNKRYEGDTAEEIEKRKRIQLGEVSV